MYRVDVLVDLPQYSNITLTKTRPSHTCTVRRRTSFLDDSQLSRKDAAGDRDETVLCSEPERKPAPPPPPTPPAPPPPPPGKRALPLIRQQHSRCPRSCVLAAAGAAAGVLGAARPAAGPPQNPGRWGLRARASTAPCIGGPCRRRCRRTPGTREARAGESRARVACCVRPSPAGRRGGGGGGGRF